MKTLVIVLTTMFAMFSIEAYAADIQMVTIPGNVVAKITNGENTSDVTMTQEKAWKEQARILPHLNNKLLSHQVLRIIISRYPY